MSEPKYGYMCLTDFEWELGEDGAKNTKIYRSLKELEESRGCIDECGWVRVEIRKVDDKGASS